MAEPQQGEIYHWPEVRANHPMGDHKIHMWVVVSRDAFNRHSNHVLACPLTSYPPTEIDIEVKATPHNRLSHNSALLARMITPILKEELSTPVVRLPASVVGHVLESLRLIIEA